MIISKNNTPKSIKINNLKYVSYITQKGVTMSFALTNVDVLTSAIENQVLLGQNVVVENGQITSISQDNIPDHIKHREDGSGKMIIPGFVNTHTHASMSMFRGLGEGRKDRLTKFFFPLEKKAVSKELVFLGALKGLSEMLIHGTTAFWDMYYFEDEVGRAAEVLGMRGVIGETIINFPAPDTEKPYGGLDIAHASAERWKDHPLISFAYAPHATYTVEPIIMKEIIKNAQQNHSQISMHVAEFEDEHQRIQKISDIKSNETIIQYLDRHNIIPNNGLFAHMIFVDSEDMKLLKPYNIRIAHCPIANAKAGKGIAPIKDFYEQGFTIGLATDGPLSGNRLSLRDVISYAYSMSKLKNLDPTALLPHEILHFATKGGYECLGISDGGELKVGSKADFSLINCNDIGMQPNYEPISNIVLSMSDRAIEGTWVNGKKVVEEGQILNSDWSNYQKEIRNLIKNLDPIISNL